MCTKITSLIKGSKVTFSFEVTPDISTDLIDTVKVEPLFYSVTWHAKKLGCLDLDVAPLRLAKYLRNKNKEVLLHLSCDLLKKPYLDELLKHLQEHGLCNLFVVLGESYDESKSDFKSCKDLIKYIRTATDDYFCIGVTGYPANATPEIMIHLWKKVNAGANFIITQAFLNDTEYEDYEFKLNVNVIDVPTFPGAFLFSEKAQLKKFSDMCKVKISDSLLEETKFNDKLGAELLYKHLKSIIARRGSVNFHFFTFDRLNDVSDFLFNYKLLLK